jgi:UDP-2,3-diacylglucosamine hydrolase
MSAGTAAGAKGPLAMLCGGGSLPLAVADKVTAGGRSVLLFPLRGAAEGTAVERFPHHWVHIGQIGKFLRLARAAGCRDVVFIGSLVRPAVWRLRPDLKTLRLLPRIARIFRGGDDHLLSGIAAIFEEHGFRLIGAHEIAPEILMPEGTVGSMQPDSRDRADIARGLALLDAISPFDIGQAVVVADGRVVAIEAAEGTDQMLARVGEMRRNGQLQGLANRGVLVKAAKRGQDRRLDLPSIGPHTVAAAEGAGLAGIAVTAGSAIIAEPDRIGAAADRAKLFIIGVPASQSKSATGAAAPAWPDA